MVIEVYADPIVVSTDKPVVANTIKVNTTQVEAENVVKIHQGDVIGSGQVEEGENWSYLFNEGAIIL